jgi:magnesium transporter
MKGTLTQDGVATDATRPEIVQAAAGGAFFWLNLDIHDPGPDDDVTGLLINTFHFHPVAVEAVDHWGQRARIDDYDDFVHIITFGIAADGKRMAEVHCFITEKFIISLHQGDCPAMATVHDRIGNHHSSDVAAPQVAIFYLIMDSLVDSFFPVLSDFDDSIDDLEGAILKNPTEQQLGTLFDMKRQIMAIRKVVTPQRDMISSLNAGMVAIPGMTDQGTAYFRNLYDHLIRISDMVDAYRDLIGGAMDTHLSMAPYRVLRAELRLADRSSAGRRRLLPLPRHRLRVGRARAPVHPLQTARLAWQRPHGLSGPARSAICASRRPPSECCRSRTSCPNWPGTARTARFSSGLACRASGDPGLEDAGAEMRGKVTVSIHLPAGRAAMWPPPRTGVPSPR